MTREETSQKELQFCRNAKAVYCFNWRAVCLNRISISIPTSCKSVLRNLVISRLPPPRKHDVLFRFDPEWWTNACPNPFSDGREYREGYRTAALSLAIQACQDSSLLDVYLYPTIFLYRHYTELTFKESIFTATDLLGRKRYPHGHNLKNLWAELKPLLNQVCEHANYPPFPIEDVEGIEAYIDQMHQLDGDGARFRYLWTSKKQRSLPSDLQQVNIRIVATAFEMLADYLDGVASFFDSLFQAKSDY